MLQPRTIVQVSAAQHSGALPVALQMMSTAACNWLLGGTHTQATAVHARTRGHARSRTARTHARTRNVMHVQYLLVCNGFDGGGQAHGVRGPPLGVRYPRDCVRQVLQTMGCKNRHAQKIAQLVFARVGGMLPELGKPAHRRNGSVHWALWHHAPGEVCVSLPRTEFYELLTSCMAELSYKCAPASDELKMACRCARCLHARTRARVHACLLLPPACCSCSQAGAAGSCGRCCSSCSALLHARHALSLQPARAPQVRDHPRVRHKRQRQVHAGLNSGRRQAPRACPPPCPPPPRAHPPLPTSPTPFPCIARAGQPPWHQHSHLNRLGERGLTRASVARTCCTHVRARHALVLVPGGCVLHAHTHHPHPCCMVGAPHAEELHKQGGVAASLRVDVPGATQLQEHH